MAISWCGFVDGIAIFPKLPVYLRNYHPTMETNQFIKDSSKIFAQKEAQLSQVMFSTASCMSTSNKNLSLMRPTGIISISSSDSNSNSDSNSSSNNNNNNNATSFFNISGPTSTVISETSSDSSLAVVSICKMNPKRKQVEEVNLTRKKYKPRTEISRRNCVYCRDVCNEIVRAETCSGRKNNMVCPHKTAALEVVTNSSDVAASLHIV